MSKFFGQSRTYRRIIVKIGTNVLIGPSGKLDLEFIGSLAAQISEMHDRGLEVILVSSGAIASGAHVLGLNMENQDVRSRQALAAVGQSRLMHTYEQIFDEYQIVVAQALISKSDITDREGYLNVRNTLVTLLELGTIPIINENDVVAVEEIGVKVFGDNDNLSSMVANLVDADMLIILSDIDGLYDMDPREHPEAKLIPKVDKISFEIEAMAGEAHSSRSRGGMQAKLDAIKIATASGVAVVLVNGKYSSVLKTVLEGDNVGTFFTPSSSKLESRKKWMLGNLSNQGNIVIDSGASAALVSDNGSLLPAGIKEVTGDFLRGEIIGVEDIGGNSIACGIVNYDSLDISTIKGAQSDNIIDLLGYYYGEEVIHRNNMVLL